MHFAVPYCECLLLKGAVWHGMIGLIISKLEVTTQKTFISFSHHFIKFNIKCNIKEDLVTKMLYNIHN